MNNSTKIAIIVSIIVVVIMGLIFALTFKNNEAANNQIEYNDSLLKTENTTDIENLSKEEAVDMLQQFYTEAGETASVTPEIVEVQEVIAKDMIAEANSGEFVVEFMTNQEKEVRGIDTSFRVQVLGRSPNGEILGYKFILSDGDVVNSLKELEF